MGLKQFAVDQLPSLWLTSCFRPVAGFGLESAVLSRLSKSSRGHPTSSLYASPEGGELETGMTKLQTTLATLLASFAMCGVVVAQSARPITNSDVLGEWTLTITPADRPGFRITIEAPDGGPTNLPLTITGQAAGRLTCVVNDLPVRCRIEGGKLVISAPPSSDGARMTFTLADRTRAGFSGAARLSIRFLPIGGHIGSVNMARR